MIKTFKLVILCCMVALATAKPGFVIPLAYSVFPVDSSVSQYSTSVVRWMDCSHGSLLYTARVYSAPYVIPAVVPAVAGLSQTPNSPAVVLDGVNVPLDTPEVIAARVVHYQAKALAGVHHLKKRSLATFSYSAIVVSVPHSTVVSPVSPLTYSSPLVLAYTSSALVPAPFTYSGVWPKEYGVYTWKK